MSTGPAAPRLKPDVATSTTDSSTADRVLDSAESLVQTRGFNGFSYAHIAAELGTTKASVHYHFPSKAALGEALIDRYAARFAQALEAIDAGDGPARPKLDAYAELYAEVLRGKRMCLCGILAAEYLTLPESMSAAIVRFFDENEAWLARVLADGRDDGSVHFDGDPRAVAQVIIGGLEGAMLLARPYGDLARFDAAARRLLAAFDGVEPPVAP